MINAMQTPAAKRHPFSLTLGEGPYKYVGSYNMAEALAHQEAYGSTEQAFRYAPRLAAGLGTCAHCGHAILDIRVIQRGDGKLYGVGSDCVMKAACEGDVSDLSALERQVRADDRRKRDERKARKDGEANQKSAALDAEYVEAILHLKAFPHPNPYFASTGKTLADYFEFCLRGASGVKKLKLVQGAIKRAEIERAKA